MTRLTTLILALLFPPVMAQEIINLWPAGAIPNAIAGASLTETTETDFDNILRISDVSVPTLTVFLPPKEKATGAAVMICPGGGYWLLASGHEGADVARWLNEMGVAAFVLKYRLPNEKIMVRPHEVPLLDARQGMLLIRQNAARFGLNPQKIGVLGFSAGGHLAATLSTHYEKEPQTGTQTDRSPGRPDFSVLIYPVITFGDKAHGGSRDKLLGGDKSPELIRYYSAELQVTAQTPPTLLIHSQDDTGVPVENSVNYFLALKAANVPAEMHLYPTGGHGYGLRVANKGTVSGWPDAAKRWLMNQIK
jgi:acetyl esterase/lipase